MHLVTGATGTVGRHVVEDLLAQGVAVRATSRHPASAGLPPRVEVVRHDELDPLLVGVETVFINPAATADVLGDLLVRAKACGVRGVVLLSTSAVLDEASPIGAHHRELERQVRSAGLRWTALRPGVFASNTLSWSAGIRAEGVVRAPYADARIAPIDERDIAAVAVRAMLTEAMAGMTPLLTGPEQLTQADQVRSISRAIGVPLRFEEVAPDTMHQALVEEGVPAPVANGLLRYYAQAVLHPVEPSPAVSELTGTAPHTFADWAANHAAAFTPAQQEAPR